MSSAEIIPKLHELSTDLRQLKHLFEGTKALIQKIRTPRNLDMTGSRALPVARDVLLSSTATDRFERLEDRLQLLMLNRIQEYLEEQKALSNTVRHPCNVPLSSPEFNLTRFGSTSTSRRRGTRRLPPG